jgi:hypothetical protein
MNIINKIKTNQLKDWIKIITPKITGKNQSAKRTAIYLLNCFLNSFGRFFDVTNLVSKP